MSITKTLFTTLIIISLVFVYSCSDDDGTTNNNGDSDSTTDGDSNSNVDGDLPPQTDGDSTTPPTDGDTTTPADGDSTTPVDGDIDPIDTKVTIAHSEILSDTNGKRDDYSTQLKSRSEGFMVYSSCGKSGIVYRERTETRKSEYAVKFTEFDDKNAKTTETVFTTTKESDVRNFGWAVVYDSSCEPNIYRTNVDKYEHWTRSGSTWSSVDLDLGLTAALGEAPTRLYHKYATIGADGKLHLLFDANFGTSNKFVNAVEYGRGWSISSGEKLSGTMLRIDSWVIDKDGAVHISYSNDRHLYYGKFKDGSWTNEMVLERENFDTEPAYGSFLALKSDGTPAIASTFIQRVQTGSFQYGELRIITKQADGKWASTTLQKQSDNYQGGDGSQYTGMDPVLLFDSSDRPHISFTDMSSWHSGNGNDYISGNLRYAFHNGTNWVFKTIYAQKGQTESANPLNAFTYPAISIAADGATAIFTGVEQIIKGDTILFDTEVEIDYKLHFFKVTSEINK